jgi:hypothetical protein
MKMSLIMIFLRIWSVMLMKLVRRVPYLYSCLYVLSIILGSFMYAFSHLNNCNVYVNTVARHYRGCLKFTCYLTS